MNNSSNPHTTGRHISRNVLRALGRQKIRQRENDARLTDRMAGAILLLAEAGRETITEADLIQQYGFTLAEITRVGTKARAIAARANPALLESFK